ncbi:YchJ family protein [Cryobacterium sp. TMT2-15-1]|uniref:YchJ family protein n=1 Tax=Cryobacterium sp. TMT2-15-1 TaxID=1259246 RepID=UPI001F5460C0|nr:YchJ family protein [Cryobacterium sp. TMT2-15-1]
MPETSIHAESPQRPRPCPCLSGNPYSACCGRFHRGDAFAPTAEALMRSRYAAFAVGEPDYLLTTWHPLTRPEVLELDADVRWLRLEIERTKQGGPFDTEGVVEFTAHSRSGGVSSQQHEISRFVRLNRRWVYQDAV